MVHFELHEEKILGEGSFGKVYQCRWHGSPAAAKQFNIMKADETTELTQEIGLIKELRNDYIIQFFGTAHHKGKLCLITSYAEKGCLRRALEHRIISNALKPSIITGLIRGMHYLKSNNVVHRDLKSPNVLLDPSFVPKICDFGLARIKLNSATMTRSSSAVGTIRWMAPELFQRKPRYSFASDVYALGVVIWEVLTEKLPYAETMDNDLVKGFIRDGENEDIPDSVPEHYKSIIKNCWHLDPKDRISVEEISTVNDEVLSQMNTVPDGDEFGKDLAVFVQAANVGYGYTLSQQQSTAYSLSSMQGATKHSETKDYGEILEQYLVHTFGDLDTKVHLVSVLNTHGESFTHWIKAAANQGNDAAVTLLGAMCFHGCGVPQDYQVAFEQFSIAAKEKRSFLKVVKLGNSCAQNSLGWMFTYGKGVSKNYDKAVGWYKKAAEKGNMSAQVNLGWMYANGHGVPQCDDKAIKLFTKNAEQGHAYAQYSLGWMYANGRGVPQSHDKAVEWYTKAADQGDARAQNNLGVKYQNGRGVPRSDDNAVELYTKAAHQGHGWAQCNLGWMYANGRGVPQSDDKAVQWYTKAAHQGHARAQSNLGQMYQEGRGVEQCDSKAIELYMKAVEQGDIYAQNNLGWMYSVGRGVPQSDAKAVEWYTKAAERGHASAQNRLGVMYQNGRGVPQSDNTAVKWYTKAALHGLAWAQCNLGWMYANGQGVLQSDDKAVEWYMKAAEQGLERAKDNLRRMNQEGQGIAQNDSKALNCT